MPPQKKTGWGKYTKHDIKSWEKEPEFKDWLEESSEKDVLDGKPEAYCKWCKCHLRAQHHDLLVHNGRNKHKANRQSRNKGTQSTLTEDHGYVAAGNEEKEAAMQLAVFIAMHCAIKSIDHLGEILKRLGKGSKLEKLRLHRTKCSKLIENVIAPDNLSELLRDVGTAKYSLIVDESTDVSTIMFMAVCIRYYSRKHKKFITDFLGIIQVVSAKGADLSQALLEYLEKIGLILDNFHSVGTDCAPSMVGVNNSFFTHLRRRLPNLILIKCVCHSLHKCAEHAFKRVPQHLQFILTETYNWISGSTKRLAEYVAFYKARHDGKAPHKFLSLSTTRWLIWLPVSGHIVDQWEDIRAFLKQALALPDNRNDTTLSSLMQLYENQANLLYLTFLRAILKDVDRVNQAFEHTDADITKLYSDLRNVVYSVAGRILKDRAIAETTRPGVLRADEAQMLKDALSKPENHLPIDQAKFGENFKQLSKRANLADNVLLRVKQDCCNYLLSLSLQLVERLPSNLGAIRKLQNLTPKKALAKVGRPSFDQLPLDLDPTVDLDALESQWQTLGILPLHEICPHTDRNSDLNSMDIEHFWSCVLECETATGERPFQDLALFALMALTLPISNAVVERIFSFMSLIKTKLRNRMQMKMLEALIRLRAHLKAFGKCCIDFTSTAGMLQRFTARMYDDYIKDDMPNAAAGAAAPPAAPAGAALEDDGDPNSPEAMMLADDEKEIQPHTNVFHVPPGEDLTNDLYKDLMDFFEDFETNCPIARLN